MLSRHRRLAHQKHKVAGAESTLHLHVWKALAAWIPSSSICRKRWAQARWLAGPKMCDRGGPWTGAEERVCYTRICVETLCLETVPAPPESLELWSSEKYMQSV